MLCSVQIVESPKKQYDFVISCLICVVFPHFNLKSEDSRCCTLYRSNVICDLGLYN